MTSGSIASPFTVAQLIHRAFMHVDTARTELAELEAKLLGGEIMKDEERRELDAVIDQCTLVKSRANKCKRVLKKRGEG